MLKYQAIWDEIKLKRCAEFTVHESIAETVLQGVKRTKSAENATRSAVGLVPYSKLVVEKKMISERTGMMKFRLSLLYDTRF